MFMKKIWVIACFSLFLVSSAFATKHPPSALRLAKPIDRVAVIVNNDVITERQISRAYTLAFQQMQTQGVAIPSETALKTEVLNQLIAQKLQLQLAKQNHMSVTDQEARAAITSIAKQHNMSLSALKQAVLQHGVSYPAYTKEIKNQILMSTVEHQALTKDVVVTNDEVSQFLKKNKIQATLEQYHLVDIIIPLSSTSFAGDEKQARAKAMQVLQSLRHGANIDSLPSSEVNDLGWKTSANLPDIFAKQLKNMKVGELSDLLFAPNGYHVLKLAGVKKGDDSAYRKEAKRVLTEQKFQKALRVWLVQLRSRAYVKIVKTE